MLFFFLFLGLAFGVVLGYSREIPMLSVAIATLLVLLFPAIKKKLWLPYLVAIGCGLGLGLLHFPYAEGSGKITGIVIRTGDNYFLLWRPFLCVYVLSKNHTYQVGDILQIDGTLKSLKITSYESKFDFARYLHYYGVSQEMDYPTITSKFCFFYRFNVRRKEFLSQFNANAASLLSSLVFGRQDDGEVTSLASAMNVGFALSASGLLVQRVAAFFRWFVSHLCKKEKVADLLSSCFLLLFLPLCFRKCGIARVILVSWLSYGNKYHAKSRFHHLDLVCISGILLILLFRFVVFQTGFVLGYGISLALCFSRPTLQQIENKHTKDAATLLWLRLLLLPTSINSNGNFHLFGLLLSVLTMPFAVVFGFLGFFSFISFPFTAVLNPFGDAFYSYLSFLHQIDLVLPLPTMDLVTMFIYYLCLALAWMGVEWGIPCWRRAIPITFVTASLLSLLPVVPWISCQVSFINVGQGDSILFRDGLTSVLLDTGGNIHFDMAQEVLIPYFRKERIYSIDCLIASHHDYDHIGAKDSLCANFNVKRYVDEAAEFPLTIGSFTFTNFNTFTATEENDSSLVLRLEFMDKVWMMMGDAPISVENKILATGADVDCDILKVGHHGSDTSSGEAWIKATSPTDAIVSVGAGNSYGHPKEEVLERLERYGAKIRRTDQEGTITYAMMKNPWL